MRCAIDICNRPYLGFSHNFDKEKVGEFDVELVEEFLHAFVNNARVSLHVNIKKGTNTHHKIESCFKALGNAFTKQHNMIREQSSFNQRNIISDTGF